MLIKAVPKLFIFQNIVSLQMPALHLDAHVSFFDRLLSILVLPAHFLYVEMKLAPATPPLKLFSMMFPFLNAVSNLPRTETD